MSVTRTTQNPRSKRTPFGDQSPHREKQTSNNLKGAFGFVAGAVGAAVLICMMFPQDDSSDFAILLLALSLIAGFLMAKRFQGFTFISLFDRLTFGMKRRLPIAIYLSWALVWTGYLLASKYDFREWYDLNTHKFWSMLIIPPTVIVAGLILFRWADKPA